MAIATRGLLMFALQNIARLAVIKTRFAIFPANQGKLQAVMIAMADRTRF